VLKKLYYSAAALATFLCLEWVVSAGPGYLKNPGPAPLRFQPVPQPITVRPVLPPPPVETPETNSVAQTNAVETLAVTTMVSTTPAIELPVQTNLVIGVPTDEETVSPQMLLKYFNKSTNGPTTTIIAPFNFAPPRSSVPSSTATYTNTP